MLVSNAQNIHECAATEKQKSYNAGGMHVKGSTCTFSTVWLLWSVYGYFKSFGGFVMLLVTIVCVVRVKSIVFGRHTWISLSIWHSFSVHGESFAVSFTSVRIGHIWKERTLVVTLKEAGLYFHHGIHHQTANSKRKWRLEKSATTTATTAKQPDKFVYWPSAFLACKAELSCVSMWL